MNRKNSEIINNDPRAEEIKVCTDCGKHLPRKDFTVSNVKKNGTVVRRPYCKKCDAIRQTKKRREKGIDSKKIPTKIKDGIIYYQCNICGEFKPKIAFPKDSYKYNKIGISRPCKECRKHQHKIQREADVSEFLTEDQIYEHDKHYGSISRIKKLLLNLAKERAKRKGIEFNITENDIELPKKCPILEIPIIPGIGTQSPNSPSIDRIDSSKGYVKGNVAIISYKANAMKNGATLDEMKTFTSNIITYMENQR